MTLEDEWEAFAALDAPDFPAAGGVDLDLLVEDATDCVRIFLMTGTLDPGRRGQLRACEADLAAALPALFGSAADYLARLGALAGGVLTRVDHNRPSWLG